jgi:hypothetical protein
MYTLGNQWTINSGDPVTLYFQIIDTNQAIQGNNSIAFGGYGGYASGSAFSGVTGVGTTAGLRYLVGVGSANQPYGVKVTFPSIDSNQVLTVPAVQADPNDSSIWSVSIPATQAIGGGNVQFAVTQGNNVSRFSVLNMLDVLFPRNVGGC